MKPDSLRAERRWVLAWAVVVVAVSSLPYLYGAAITPHGYRFVGFTHNIDDAFVYMSWARQAADGSFFIRNLFTNEPQAGRAFNVLFLAMGWTARYTHLPPEWVFHLFRAVLGTALIMAVWSFGRRFLVSREQRKMLVLLAGFSSGIGWLIPGARMPVGPIDEWQPEAVTFLSIYLNPLFLAGMLLMLGTLHYLLAAEKTGRFGDAVRAGICLLVLGNVHTYDVVTTAAVWTAYLAASAFLDRAVKTRTLCLSFVAALTAAPAAAYQYWVYRTDEVFRVRVHTPAESPAVWSLLAGYGLVLAGAAAGAVLAARRTAQRDSTGKTANDVRLLIAWAVTGFIIPYAPFAQQRKLIMGLHIPLCVLCAYAAGAVLQRIAMPWRRLALVGFVAAASITNVLFVSEDIRFLNQGTTAPRYPAYVSEPELAAMRWIAKNTPADSTILAPPSFSLFTPGFTGRQVYYGHWSETPDYAGKIRQWVRAEKNTRAFESLLRQSRADYFVIFGSSRPAVKQAGLHLEKVFESPARPTVVVYRVGT